MNECWHYICEFKLDGKIRYIIWYSSEENGAKDGILMEPKNRVVALDSLDRTHVYLKEKKLPVGSSESIPVYDFDRISSWCIQPDPEQIDCTRFLDTWNMFTDLASSIGSQSEFDRADHQMNDVYDKLFYGSNLPAITPPGKIYEPIWSQDEAHSIGNLFVKGLQDLRSVLPD